MLINHHVHKNAVPDIEPVETSVTLAEVDETIRTTLLWRIESSPTFGNYLRSDRDLANTIEAELEEARSLEGCPLELECRTYSDVNIKYDSLLSSFRLTCQGIEDEDDRDQCEKLHSKVLGEFTVSAVIISSSCNDSHS